MTADNRKRALSEVASLDAWHGAFSASSRRAKLFVDVAFGEGRIGDEMASPVRFRLRMRRAKVVVVVPANEPASVVKASVSRDAPVEKIHVTERNTDKREGRIKAASGIIVKPSRASLKLSAAASAAMSSTAERATKISRTLSSMQVTQVIDGESNYAWEIAPTSTDVLAGRPWNASKQPRLAFTDTRTNPERGIAPVIRVELRCRREDLEISDLTYKNVTLMSRLKRDPFSRNKLIAAEAIIRTRLLEAGLLSGDISDPFAEITISATLADPG